MTKEQAIEKAKEQYSEIWNCDINHPKYEDTVEEIVTGVIRLIMHSSTDDCVSLEVYKQVAWERDIAIEQLKELGYEFGEKIRTSDDCVSREDALSQINKSWKTIETKLDFVNIVKALPPVSPTFPKGATNGDVIKTMFPDIKIHEHEKTDICDAYIQIDIWDFSICVSKDWWDAPYKRGSENE